MIIHLVTHSTVSTAPVTPDHQPKSQIPQQSLQHHRTFQKPEGSNPIPTPCNYPKRKSIPDAHSPHAYPAVPKMIQPGFEPGTTCEHSQRSAC
ncbi:hypothetical protein EJ06DRAFT_341968 [Trichodelitschia bisporula]|uniref:Uncharacterized protein n=1 Tax=Trichodelitschia bisporula TaxID=703511 RepID=A0A6G1I2T1_9PEZI|nr:hypothetical protein EJ06DRAFT_341968 [Trichodelitschia bisporula]